MHHFNSSILREYDVRGIVGDTLTTTDAEFLGKAFGTMILRNGGTRICLGFDGRLTSLDLEEALLEGLLSTGINVARVGLGPSPMLYYSVFELNTDGGMMITGSHNPPDYNGFKMMIGKASCFGEKIQELGRISAAGDFEVGFGAAEKIDLSDRYINRMLKDVDIAALESCNISVVWDMGHGATGDIVSELVKKLPGNHQLLFQEIDGLFPAHHPNPTVAENLKDLQNAVIQNNFDLGIAFDGDGDRIGVVDQKGEIIWADQLMAILAEEILNELPGSTIIGDVKCSQVFYDHVKNCGGDPIMWKTGHSLIKSKLAELNAPLAGEMSGHIFYKHKYYGFDDAIYVALRLLNIVAKTNGGMEALRLKLPQMVNTPEMRIECDEGRPFEIVEEVIEKLKNAGIEYNDLDGARVTSKDGWWLIRASNTQNVIVARCEGHNNDGLARIYSDLNKFLKGSGITLP